MMDLNGRAIRLVESLRASLPERKVAERLVEGGGHLFDCGAEARGGLLAGIDLARICLAGLAEVSLVPGLVGGRSVPAVQVTTDHPIEACLGSQYAGWAVAEGKFFAMGSGPMRAAHAREPMFAELGLAERPSAVVGVLEGRKLPTPEVFAKVALACGVEPGGVTLLIAPTASLAGGVQVVARSVETALHKLHELKFDLRRVVSAYGVAPLPPVAGNDLAAIGRTNDAILYGARVVLHVTGDDASLARGRPQGPVGLLEGPRRAVRERSSPATTTTSTPSTPTSSARPRCPSRTSRPAGPSRSGGSPTRSWPGRSSGRPADETPGRAGLGTRLARPGPVEGLGEVVGVRLDPIPFPKAGRPMVGNGGLGRVRGGGDRPGVGRRGPGPDDAAGEPGAGRLPDGCLAPARGPGGAGPEPAEGGRGGRRQVPGDWRCSRPTACPCPRPGSASRAAEALAAFERLGGDVVVKPLFGSEGRGLVRVSDPELALRTFRAIERLGLRAVRPAARQQSRIRHPGCSSSRAG